MSFLAKSSIASGLLVALILAQQPSPAAAVPLPRSPNTVRGFFTPLTGANTVLVVWSGAHVESDSVWMGYRVRRTIDGISTEPFGVVGQFKAKNTVTSACLATAQPCDLSHFVNYGTGFFFRGFHNNLTPNGFVINYPPGAPTDNCDSCWVFADPANLGGFTSHYAVTSIDTVHLVGNDFAESPIDPNEIATVEVSGPPANNLEQVAVVPNPFRASAEWDPPGQHHVHFIHLPAGSTVKIFTTNGELVQVLIQDPNANQGGTTGDLEWDLKNADRRDVVSGIYIYHVESPQGHHVNGHFVVIR